MLAMSCATPSLCSPIADPRILIPQVIRGEARRDVASSRQPLIDLHVLEKRGLFGLLGGIVSIIPIVGPLLGGALQSIDTAITSSINELKAKKSASASQVAPTPTTLAIVATAQATYVHVPSFRKQAAITTQVIAGPVAPTLIASTSCTDETTVTRTYYSTTSCTDSTTAAPTYVASSTTSCDETSAVFTTSPIPQTTRAPVVTQVIVPTPIRSTSPIAKESDCDT
ncbi:hypothetical protein PLEOSDRAFT_1102354 [Pleurotus ostreatus PC15]|uniref:Uncharacterized protein n=1 Tax=Pleurotus ostreatus (strain PC15) TaxID=1137138 RepID=A0A067NTI8_PLEO1|nr:hypothetical protein PLEOSDRAFT_1102354 [Pleurotus ostreatus PC15]